MSQTSSPTAPRPPQHQHDSQQHLYMCALRLKEREPKYQELMLEIFHKVYYNPPHAPVPTTVQTQSSDLMAQSSTHPTDGELRVQTTSTRRAWIKSLFSTTSTSSIPLGPPRPSSHSTKARPVATTDVPNLDTRRHGLDDTRRPPNARPVTTIQPVPSNTEAKRRAESRERELWRQPYFSREEYGLLLLSEVASVDAIAQRGHE